MKKTQLLPFLLTLIATTAFGFDTPNLVKNGNFSEVNEKGLPLDWEGISHPSYLTKLGITVGGVTEGDTSFLHIEKQSVDNANLGEQKVALPAEVSRIRVACKVRSSDAKRGIDWFSPGLSFGWFTETEESPVSWGKWLLQKSESSEWTDLEIVLEKPSDVRGIKISIQANGWTGNADITGIVVEPVE